MTEQNKDTKSPIDWILIEKDYRSGIKPLRQIAEEQGITHGAVNKRAKRDGWTRDLSAKIKAQADAKVSKAAVSAEVSKESMVTEKLVVEANADLQYKIRMEHRSDIGATRKLFQELLYEVQSMTGFRDLFEEIAELYDKSGPDSAGRWKTDKANELYRKIIATSGRVDNAKKLTEMLEKLVKLEREAFGITNGEEQSSPLDEILKKLHAERVAKGLA